jgi:hypothetical protein
MRRRIKWCLTGFAAHFATAALGGPLELYFFFAIAERGLAEPAWFTLLYAIVSVAQLPLFLFAPAIFAVIPPGTGVVRLSMFTLLAAINSLIVTIAVCTAYSLVRRFSAPAVMTHNKSLEHTREG